MFYPDFDRMIAQIGPDLRVVGEVAFFSDRGSNPDRRRDGSIKDGSIEDGSIRVGDSKAVDYDGLETNRAAGKKSPKHFAIVSVQGLDTPLVIPAELVSSVAPACESGADQRVGVDLDAMAAKRRIELGGVRDSLR